MKKIFHAVTMLFFITQIVAGCAGTVKISGLKDREIYDLAVKDTEGRKFLFFPKYHYYEEARVKFLALIDDYPYSEYTRKARIAIADTYFDEEKYLEAIESYAEFIRLYPDDATVEYAHFRISLADSRLILAYDRDQTSTRTARDRFLDFMLAYPKSQHFVEAEAIFKKLNAQLIEHEIYVGNFYRKQKRYDAAIKRYQYALATFASDENSVPIRKLIDETKTQAQSK